MSTFQESDSAFYDVEYSVSMEYRYLSGAHGSKVMNIVDVVGDVQGLRCLDVGCGSGFFAEQLRARGADVLGVDYSEVAVQFGKSRFPDLDLRVHSAYELESLGVDKFDVVTCLDVIEHMSEQRKLLQGILGILKPGGRVVLSTDIHGGKWEGPLLRRLVRRSMSLSADGRAYNLTKCVEARRRQFKNYHESHIGPLSYDQLVSLLESEGFEVMSYRVYPLVGVPVRDIFLRLWPTEYRGDNQCVGARKLVAIETVA